MSTAVKKTNNNNTKGGEIKKTYNKDSNNNRNNNNNNNKDTNNKDNKDNKYPPDPIYEGHQKKINEFREEIKSINSTLETLKNDMVELKSKHTGYKESIDKIYEGNKNRTVDPIKSQVIEARKQLATMIAQQEEKKKQLKSLEDQLPIKINKSSTLENTLISLENKAAELEEQIENEVNANTQRSLLKKSSQINANKRQVGEYFTHKLQYEEIREAINKKKEQVNELSSQIKPEEPKEKQNKTLQDLIAQRKSTEEEMKKNNESFVVSKKKIDEVKKQIDDEKLKQDAHVLKRKETRKLEQEQRKQEQEQRKLEYLEKKKQDEEKRIQQDLLRVPYEKEMANCDSLISYLHVITPKEKSEDQSKSDRNIAEIEEGYELVKKEKVSKVRENPKKKQQQQAVKAQPETIRHALEIFSDFEKLSMVPPPKFADIPEYIDQIKSKKEHYAKLSATQMEERLAKAKADKAEKDAAAAATEKETTTSTTDSSSDKKEVEKVEPTTTTTESSEESTPASVTPSTVEDDNTTTTATTTENNNVEVEAQ